VPGTDAGGALPFDTFTVREDDALLPAASTAVATRVWLPFDVVVVFHEIEYGAVVSSAPICVPSTRNRTRATPTSSDALAAMVTVPETVAPDAGEVSDTLGAV
jgi:hypothetical protein